MNDLLGIGIRADDGLDRCNKANSIKADTAITRAIWFVNGRVDVLKHVVISAETTQPRQNTSVWPWNFPDKISARFLSQIVWLFSPHKANHSPCAIIRVSLVRGKPWRHRGTTCTLRTLRGGQVDLPDHSIFLYTKSGFETEEISPIQSDSETWSRLKVT